MKSIISILVSLVGFLGFSQQKITEHIVSSNETISKIASYYQVKQSDILELNPEAQNGLKLKSVLFIPVAPSSKSTSLNTVFLHTVQPKEGLYSIAREYQVDVKEIFAANSGLVAELKIGQKIVIYKVQNTSITTQGSEYEVLPKETKYSIARANNLSVADLENANPILKNQDLKIGQKIIIPNKIGVKSENQTTVTNTTTTSQSNNTSLVYEVLPKETKYGIARKFNTSVEVLEKLNPEIAKGLIIGQKIFLPNPANNSSQNQSTAQKEKDEKTLKDKQTSDLVEQLVLTAFQNIGTRYRSGGTTRDEGFDCSGLIINAFNTFDIDLPRSSYEQSQTGVVVNVDEAKKGDLIFFKTGGGSQINHVGMVVEVGDGDVKFIHAASNGVIVSSIKESYYSKRLAQLNRVL